MRQQPLFTLISCGVAILFALAYGTASCAERWAALQTPNAADLEVTDGPWAEPPATNAAADDLEVTDGPWAAPPATNTAADDLEVTDGPWAESPATNTAADDLEVTDDRWPAPPNAAATADELNVTDNIGALSMADRIAVDEFDAAPAQLATFTDGSVGVGEGDAKAMAAPARHALPASRNRVPTAPAMLQNGFSCDEFSAVYDIPGLATKFAAFLAILSVACIGLVVFNRRSPLSRASKKNDGGLRIDDSITLAAGVGIKLIDVGPQRMVVGYDRQGIKNMMLIERGFDEILDDAEHSPTANCLPTPSEDSVAPCDGVEANAFLKPKDYGWDLNQRIL